MRRKRAPKYSVIRSAFCYDKKTGLFWHKIRKQGVRINKPAGCMSATGYWVIQLDYVQYYAHHLAWFYVYGIWPDMLDHKNGNRADNRLVNLRIATSSQNQSNKTVFLDKKKSKLPRGVFKCAHDASKFRARIQTQGKQIHLGQFNTITEANHAYKIASKKYFKEYERGSK